MLNLFKSELFRIRKAKSFWILTVLLILLGLLLPNMGASFNAQAITPTTAAKTGAMALLDCLGNAIFLQIVLSAFIASYLCAAFEQRTLQDSIAAGYGRGQILVSKALSVYLVAFIMMFFNCLAYVIEVLVAKGGGMGIESDILPRMILAFVAVFIQNMAQISIVILVAFALKKVGIVMAIGICIFTVGKMLITLAAFKYEFILHALDFTPFGMGVNVTSGFTVGYGDYFQIIAVNLIWIVGLLGLTYNGFRKAELR